MRIIGALKEETQAKKFADFLYFKGIENSLEEDDADGWQIWVHEEEKLSIAAEYLEEFKRDPTASTYRNATQGARSKRRIAEEKEQRARKKYRSREELLRSLDRAGFGRVTMAIIIPCILLALISWFGKNESIIRGLLITNLDFGIDSYTYRKGLPEIRSGQIWRIITPAFIHFHFLHLLFNMMWLFQLGNMIERQFSSRYLAILVLVIAIGSNLLEALRGTNLMFGGMSGVVFGLFGFIWTRGKFDPASGLYLAPTTVVFMIVWFYLCWTGAVGSIANLVHAGGLMIGAVWGYLSSLRGTFSR
jgi:GlpG protein